MELEKITEELKLEYTKLLIELEQLKKQLEISNQQYQQTKEKRDNLDNEIYYIEKDLNNDNHKNEQRYEDYIEKNSLKLLNKLLISNPLIFSIIIPIIIYLIKNYLILNSIYIIIALITGPIFIGTTTALLEYKIYKNKYTYKLIEEYKKTKDYQEYSNNHYDKQLYLIRKIKERDIQRDEYNQKKQECETIKKQIDDKIKEIETFKENVLNIIFTPVQDNKIENTESNKATKIKQRRLIP